MFANVENLRRHLEQVHQKTFCKICLKGRAIFIREQRIYHIQKLRSHIEHGDPATDRGAEILPHPWCDFCEEFFFDVQSLEKHLHQLHLTCNLCGDFEKNRHYKDYNSLEVHFAKSHYLCPYEQCKSKCYVAFRTESEVQVHLDLVHKNKDLSKVNANSLLSFGYDEDKYDAQKKREKAEKPKINDDEGVDFGFYFSRKYQMAHNNTARGGKDRGRGRGGRGRGAAKNEDSEAEH